MSAVTGQTSFSVREARGLIDDLFEHKAWIYWADLLLTLVVGYGMAGVYLQAEPFTAVQIGSMIIASFALFRAGSYIHEIVHMRHGDMLGFRVVWDLICGIPMLMPSFFYTNHIDHHKAHHYGTIRDGEYLPLGAGPLSRIFLFYAQVPLLPIYVVIRFLISPLTFLHPKFREWALEHMSSFVINFRHRLTVPKNAPRRAWAALELACFLRTVALFAVVGVGLYPWTRLVQMYALAVCVLGLNYIRNLVAHHYRNTGEEMTHVEQLEDSVNIEGHWFWTELFFPLGLRYHALHHLFPALPYHNLGKAHRRLMAQLPADSAYRTTVYPSYWAVLRELWADTHTVQEPQPQPATAA